MNWPEQTLQVVEAELVSLQQQFAHLFEGEEGAKMFTEFVAVGENALAFEEITFRLLESHTEVSTQTYERLVNLAGILNVADENWKGIKVFGTLTSA